MNYELAKRLKDAGFPQEGTQSFYHQNIWLLHKKENLWYPGTRMSLLELKDHGRNRPIKWPLFSLEKEWDWDNHIYVPTLSELIEACIKEKFQLVKLDGGWHAQSGENWVVACKGSGETPEEAVVNLWLALNKK